MANQVITVHRKKYAVGLFWQPTGVGQRVRNYARVLARSVDKKLNLYTEYRAMTGLGARRNGLRAGMPSAAAEVVDSLSEYSSFLAVFDIGGLFYLVAVRNGVILEDKLFQDAATARAEYARLFEIPDWSALIAPASWAMPRAIERKVSDIITGRARAILRPISHLRGIVFSGILLVVFLALFLGVFRGELGQMMHRPQVAQIDPELAAEYRRQIEEKNKQLDAEFDIQKPVEPEPLVMPYDNLPDVMGRANVCFQAIGFLMQPIPGWNQVSASCNESDATANIRRSFGTLGDFYAIAGNKMPNAFVDELGEDNLVVHAVLPTVKTVASQDARDAESIVRDLTTIFQGMGTDVDIDIVSDTLTNGVDVAELHIVEVAASSKLVPMQFMEIFSEFGGVYMAKCTWDAARRTWNYEVIIYAK
ncbi:MAG: type 4b pilus protein PilO2 [Muribaculaceae bacterium]|nr:type 4b pilus protein PilO2 [Muribaculaceae bacterium]